MHHVFLIGVHSKHGGTSDKTKQQLTFSQSEFPNSPVAMDTDDVTSGCVILPPTPPTKKVLHKSPCLRYSCCNDTHLYYHSYIAHYCL